ncbi:wax ester/triacylglycerol synthase family O-acyltransferase [Rhodoblastus sp.]|uniref:wax ester/triacylglycerol synthase family O-acyltransferase n=1 Tax=Rhodoblastus sp. TaxID=1962975 RepID=UPI003F9730C1
MGSERMSPVDTTWLRMDRAVNRMVIVGVMKLAPPIHLARLEQTLSARLLAYPRFRQKVEDRAAGPWWVDDPHFDIARHIRRARLPGDGGKAELQDFVAELCSQPLDLSHPLWQFHIVEDYEGGVALVARFHHAVADGMALVAVMLSMTDEEPNAPLHGWRKDERADEDELGHSVLGPLAKAIAPVAQAFDQGMQVSTGLGRLALDLLSHPAKAAGLARGGAGVASELAWLLFMPKDSPTRFKGAPSGSKRVAWTEPLFLPEIKAVGRALGCSVNDMMLSSVAGALRDYLESKGDATQGVEVRALVPLNLRPVGADLKLGNQFGIVAVELPVGIADPIARLHEVRRRMIALKNSYEAPVTLGLFAALGFAPKLVQDQLFDLLLSRATAVMTNVPGPQHQLYLAGSRLDQVMFWVPQSGDLGMGVSILSFGGKVQFGLITDAAMVPDPEAIISRFAPEFEQLLYFALMAPWGDHAPQPPPARPEPPAPEHKRNSPTKKPMAPAMKSAGTSKTSASKSRAGKTAGRQSSRAPAGKRRPPAP